MITFEQLSEVLPEDQRPFLDRKDVNLANLTPDQRQWHDNGFLIIPKFIPEPLIDAYCAIRSQTPPEKKFLNSSTPYMQSEEVRDLCLYKPLMDKMAELIGHPMAMHLNLTGWYSTERNWHQDDYLNPPYIMCHYIAVWFALDRIDPDSGVFQYIPGSHRWPLLRMNKVLSYADAEEARSPNWPKTTERFVVPATEQIIQEKGIPAESFVPEKGDVLLWHAALMHSGSAPKRPGILRKSIITHYSAIPKRIDMPNVAQHKDQGAYFVL